MSKKEHKPESLDEAALEQVIGGGAAARPGNALFGSDGGLGDVAPHDVKADVGPDVDKVSWKVSKLGPGGRMWPCKW